MTLDEAIEYYIKAATQRSIADEEMGENDKWNETKFMTKKESEQIIADNRQLAEWLTELKDLREENKVLTSECDRLIKEKGELLKKSEQIAEYKRLLKSAIDEWHIVCEWGDCGEHCVWYENGKCAQEWSGKAEALALIGGEKQ